MMDVNIWAVLLAALSSFLPGGLWYSPPLSLKPRNAALGRAEQDAVHPVNLFGPGSLFAVVATHEFALLLNSDPALRESRKAGLQGGFGFVTMSYGMNCRFARRPFSA
jgi:hypothetical protein